MIPYRPMRIDPLIAQPRINMKNAPYFVPHKFYISSPHLANSWHTIANINSEFSNFTMCGKLKNSVSSKLKHGAMKGVNPPYGKSSKVNECSAQNSSRSMCGFRST